MAVTIVVSWAIAGVFFATQNYTTAIAAGLTGQFEGEVLDMMLDAFSLSLLTPFLLYAVERAPLRRNHVLRSILILAVPVCLFAAANALFDAWSPTITDGRPLSHDAFVFVAEATFHSHFLLGGFVVTVASLLRARRENASRRIRETRIESELSRAQLQLLQAEMEPHFLFNTLNAAAALLSFDRERAATTMFTLADLLQQSQKLGDQVAVSIATEVAFLESYLQLQKVRYGARLQVRIVVDPAACDLAVPSLILQPLVENAIVHGITPRARGGTVTVNIRRDRDRLRIEVGDDGPGAAPEQLFAGRGLGLSNTRRRLQCLFKDAFDLEFLREDGHFIVRMIIAARVAAAVPHDGTLLYSQPLE
jgi:signal transduction histidine kinase